jgi:beta-glucosidase
MDAIVEAWFAGQASGRGEIPLIYVIIRHADVIKAIAEVLFGIYNPAGRLPITFPLDENQVIKRKSVLFSLVVTFFAQNPAFYNCKRSSRYVPFVDLPSNPLFAFGHGLSYSSFAYSNLQLSASEIPTTGWTNVSVNVQNTGKVCENHFSSILALPYKYYSMMAMKLFSYTCKMLSPL